jgi:hypothetical protein
MHVSAAIFVPAATFGQLIPKCDTAPYALQLPKRSWKKVPPGSSTAYDSLSAASYACRQRLENNFVLGAGILFRRTHVGVGFDFAPLLFHNATQLALHGFECVMDDFFERFVSAVIHLPFIGHKLVAWRHGHVDPAAVWITFLMVVIGLLDGDIAAVNVITKSLESC